MQQTVEHSRQTHTVLQVLGSGSMGAGERFSLRNQKANSVGEERGGKFLLSLCSSAMAPFCPFYLASFMKSSIRFQVHLFDCLVLKQKK